MFRRQYFDVHRNIDDALKIDPICNVRRNGDLAFGNCGGKMLGGRSGITIGKGPYPG